VDGHLVLITHATAEILDFSSVLLLDSSFAVDLFSLAVVFSVELESLRVDDVSHVGGRVGDAVADASPRATRDGLVDLGYETADPPSSVHT